MLPLRHGQPGLQGWMGLSGVGPHRGVAEEPPARGGGRGGEAPTRGSHRPMWVRLGLGGVGRVGRKGSSTMGGGRGRPCPCPWH